MNKFLSLSSALLVAALAAGCSCIDTSPGDTPENLCQPERAVGEGGGATECNAENAALDKWEDTVLHTFGEPYRWEYARDRIVDCDSDPEGCADDVDKCWECILSARPCFPESCDADVLLSRTGAFESPSCWTGLGSFGGWHIGDFDGDGREDIFRERGGVCGAEVLLSSGSSFGSLECWTGSGSFDGWHVGDFNGDGRDDIFRERGGACSAPLVAHPDHRSSRATAC